MLVYLLFQMIRHSAEQFGILTYLIRFSFTMPDVGTERCDFWEICVDRYQMRSTVLTSQLLVLRCQRTDRQPDVSRWRPRPALHSMRKNRGKPER
jgi:hypothetical protein